MAKVNGTNLGVYIDGDLQAAATSCEISFSSNMLETTSKDSAGDAEFLPGLRNATVSTEALYTDASSDLNQDDLFTMQKDRTKVVLIFGVNTTGKVIYTADAYISSLSISAPMEDVTTYSVEFQITGSVVKSTVS